MKQAKLLFILILYILVCFPCCSKTDGVHINACFAREESGDEKIHNIYLKISGSSKIKCDALTAPDRKAIFDFLSNDSVTAFSSIKKYDPLGMIGFCFGRAMAAHLKALQMGLDPKSIVKVFIIGDLKYNGVTEYRFHVATVLKGDDDKWYAFDTTRGMKLQTFSQWIEECRRIWDKEQKARIYLVPPCAVIPDVRIFPDIEKEKGEYIIEISFNPAENKGFVKSEFMGVELFSPDEKALKEYFLCADAHKGKSFDFREIKINNDVYFFNNYFLDLMKVFITKPKKN